MPARFWAKRSEVERLKKEVQKLRDDLRRVEIELKAVRGEADEQWNLPDALNAHNAIDHERVYEPESQIVTKVVLGDAMDRTRCRCGNQRRTKDHDAHDEPTENRTKLATEERHEEEDSPSSQPAADSTAQDAESTASSPVSSTCRSFFLDHSSSHSSLFDSEPRATTSFSPPTRVPPPTETHARKPVPAKSQPVAQTISITPRGAVKARPTSSRLNFTRERFESSVRDYHIRRY